MFRGPHIGNKNAIIIGIELIECIKNLHSLGYVHTDIKLDNVMLDQESHIVLIDFGLAQKFELENGDHRPNIRLDRFKGNPHFASRNAVDC